MDKKEIEKLLKLGRDMGQENHPLFKILEAITEAEAGDALHMGVIDIGAKTKEFPSNEEVAKTWKQVATLTGEEKLRRRALEKNATDTSREVDLMNKKLKALAAVLTLEREEFWNNLYKNHSLPKANYHINDDGAIFMDPKSLER